MRTPLIREIESKTRCPIIHKVRGLQLQVGDYRWPRLNVFFNGEVASLPISKSVAIALKANGMSSEG